MRAAIVSGVEVTAEHERKLEASEGFELPDLGGDPLEPRLFTSVYYDTVDGSLARAWITLRRRTERGKSVWQLKLPATASRLEIEEPGGPTQPPEPLRKLLYAHLRHGPVAPVAELRTRRHGSLVARNGTTAEVTVDEVAVMDARRVAGGFVEVEIELRTGSPKRLEEIAAEVEEAGARRTDGVPKVFRALGIVPAQPDAVEDPFERLRGLVRVQLCEVLAHDPGTRLGADPESLHDMRVAVRRSRALLGAGRTLIEGDLQAFADELKWIGGVLGAVRDLDVLLEHLRERADGLGQPDARAAGRLLRTLERRRTSARRALMRALESPRYLELLDRFEHELDGLTRRGTETTLDALLQKQSRKARKAASRLGEEPADTELHELRKLGKRVRYAAELAGQEAVVKRAKKLQDVLGEHQDAVVAEEALRGLAADAPAALALAAGRLVEGERKRKAAARATWRKTWKRLRRAA